MNVARKIAENRSEAIFKINPVNYCAFKFINRMDKVYN